jgi:hypothetical protein
VSEPRSEKPAARLAARSGWQFAVFRAWRERDHPRTAYLIAPAVWRRESRLQAEDASKSARRALKNWEPRLTGAAYSARDVYLVEVVGKLSAEHIGRMLYLADLFRVDADYAEHRSKRVHLVMVVREAAPSVFEFARRRRIRVVVLRTDDTDDSRGDTDASEQKFAPPAEIAEERESLRALSKADCELTVHDGSSEAGEPIERG